MVRFAQFNVRSALNDQQPSPCSCSLEYCSPSGDLRSFGRDLRSSSQLLVSAYSGHYDWVVSTQTAPPPTTTCRSVSFVKMRGIPGMFRPVRGTAQGASDEATIPSVHHRTTVTAPYYNVIRCHAIVDVQHRVRRPPQVPAYPIAVNKYLSRFPLWETSNNAIWRRHALRHGAVWAFWQEPLPTRKLCPEFNSFPLLNAYLYRVRCPSSCPRSLFRIPSFKVLFGLSPSLPHPQLSFTQESL